MSRQDWMKLLAVALAVVNVGCSTPDRVEQVTANYRTVNAGPLRDTDSAKLLNQQGLQKLDEGELDAAAKLFTTAIEKDVEFGPAHNNLGKVFYAQKDWYQAAWEFEIARKQLPRRSEPRNNLGLVLENAGEFDRAVDYYREAVGLAPDSIVYKANLVRALIRRGERTREVHDLLNEIIEKDTRPEWLIWAKQQVSRGKHLQKRGFPFEK